jgi:hypothetical protein
MQDAMDALADVKKKVMVQGIESALVVLILKSTQSKAAKAKPE